MADAAVAIQAQRALDRPVVRLSAPVRKVKPTGALPLHSGAGELGGFVEMGVAVGRPPFFVLLRHRLLRESNATSRCPQKGDHDGGP